MKAATKSSKAVKSAAPVKAVKKPAVKQPVAKKPVAAKVTAKKPAAVKAKPAVKPAPAKKAPAKSVARKPKQDTGQVLQELKSLAKELNKAAKGIGKKGPASNNPKEVSTILGNVERMTAEAATKSLTEAETAKGLVTGVLDSLSKDWSRKDIDTALRGVSSHLTNIIVAQEFQDLAGQALRKAMKALVGAIIVVEGGGPTEDQRLSQKDVDSLLKDLMP